MGKNKMIIRRWVSSTRLSNHNQAWEQFRCGLITNPPWPYLSPRELFDRRGRMNMNPASCCLQKRTGYCLCTHFSFLSLMRISYWLFLNFKNNEKPVQIIQNYRKAQRKNESLKNKKSPLWRLFKYNLY